jgi:hypothetical protein
MEKLSEILKDLEQGKISADNAEDKVLRLFNVMLSLPNVDELQNFINNSEARKTFQGTPCFAQERLAFDSAVRETINRLRERGNGA